MARRRSRTRNPYTASQIAKQLSARLRHEGLGDDRAEDMAHAARQGADSLFVHLAAMDTDLRGVLREIEAEARHEARGFKPLAEIRTYRNALAHVRRALRQTDTLLRTSNPKKKKMRPSYTKMHPDIELFRRQEGGMFDVEPDEMDLNIGRLARFKDWREYQKPIRIEGKNYKHTHAELYQIITTQKNFRGDKCYRGVSLDGDGPRADFGNIMCPGEVVFVATSSLKPSQHKRLRMPIPDDRTGNPKGRKLSRNQKALLDHLVSTGGAISTSGWSKKNRKLLDALEQGGYIELVDQGHRMVWMLREDMQPGRKTNPAGYMRVAETIKQQIGHRAFVMMGAKEFMGGDGGLGTLKFKLGRGARDHITHVMVTLEPSDTYTVAFLRWHGGKRSEMETVAEYDDVYVENLRSLISKVTGFALRL